MLPAPAYRQQEAPDGIESETGRPASRHAGPGPHV